MAEKIEEEKASSSIQNLICPLCLDIFEEATLLTCEHTFCRKCLKKYDLSHQDLDHMVCPLCRKSTNLLVNRVYDLPANVSVNGLVDDYHARSGGVNAVLEVRSKCTACDFQGDAVSYCRTCNNFMCDECLHCHRRLKSVFGDHEIVSIQDITEGNVSIGLPSEKCSTHKQENKDMFCEDCKVHVCLKCFITGHRDHKIKTHEDFEKGLKIKVDDLIQRCTSKRSEFEKNIRDLEENRHEVHDAMQKLREDVSQAYNIKAKQLEENQRILIEKIDALQGDFDDDLDALKSNNRQRIKSICSSIDLVANDRLSRLERDSLSAHTLLCEELDGMLKEATDQTSASAITKKAQKKRFKPADDTRLELGKISEPEPEPARGDMLKGNTSMTDGTSASGITEKAKKQGFKPAKDNHLDLENITDIPLPHIRVTEPELQIIQRVDLRAGVFGMTKYSDDSVAVGYPIADGIDIISSFGNIHRYANIPSNIKCYGLVFQRDRTLCTSRFGNYSQVNIYSDTGTQKSTIHVASSGENLKLNRSPTDEILIVNNGKHVYIYDPTGTTLKHTVPTKHNITVQASATKTGLIVTSSCLNYTNVVTVYDRDGNAGKPLQAPNGVYLYADVDEQDRVYVASVDYYKNNVVIRLYDIDGLNLKERVKFNALNLTLGSGWCYLVCLDTDMLAFVCGSKLYFIKVSP